MSEAELNAFLGDGGTGVISFSTPEGDAPYSLPVSYGYLAEKRHFHFRFAFPPSSEKEEVVDRPISFVTYGESEEGWQSVVATGRLEDLTEVPYDSDAMQERWQVTIPLVDIFEEPPDDVTFRQFRLVPDQITGRKQVSSGV
jgi:hypothetical protein